ncbi:MAG: hypothetical protein JWO77_2139 [Ilumatobacteraceae bacterium]|nr:hypothetical protein [Ilumatobacteraceae bacterium]
MDTALDTVIIDPPASVLAERERLGLDRHDEVWDGEYHMVPQANNEHMRVEGELYAALLPVVRRTDLEIRIELGLFDPAVAGNTNFRVPDLVIYAPEIGSLRGADGAAALVVEIRSPGDDSFRKLPHYQHFSVGEVLIIDRDTKVVRRWELVDGVLVESPGGPIGHHHLGCIPASLHTDDGVLVVTTDEATTRI